MSVGRARRVGGGWRSAWTLAALLYAITLAASPLLHHDISCELKSRTHCTTCVSGVAGPGLAHSSDPPALNLPRAGSIAAVHDVPAAAPRARSLNGRSPPLA
jgi:hypothetical protein